MTLAAVADAKRLMLKSGTAAPTTPTLQEVGEAHTTATDADWAYGDYFASIAPGLGDKNVEGADSGKHFTQFDSRTSADFTTMAFKDDIKTFLEVMASKKCGGLQPQAARKNSLKSYCKSTTNSAEKLANWGKVGANDNSPMTAEEFQFFKCAFPKQQVPESAEGIVKKDYTCAPGNDYMFPDEPKREWNDVDKTHWEANSDSTTKYYAQKHKCAQCAEDKCNGESAEESDPEDTCKDVSGKEIFGCALTPTVMTNENLGFCDSLSENQSELKALLSPMKVLQMFNAKLPMCLAMAFIDDGCGSSPSSMYASGAFSDQIGAEAGKGAVQN